ncbi:MAG TPA: hypothetical protein VEZ16_16310 [Microvirga sp.]|nr:hypothetical protein [Microvirga sp.]
MRRLLWALAWICVALWSLFAWGAYGLFDLFGGVAIRNADIVTGHPETVEWLSWALGVLRGLGLAAIVVVWAVISLLILAVPAILGLFLGHTEPRGRERDWSMQRQYPGGPDRLPPGSADDRVRRIERR